MEQSLNAYISLSVFSAATVAIGVVWLFEQRLHNALWIPNILAVIGTVILFYGCVMLIAETRLALRSVNSEMEFTLRLREKYKQQRAAAKAEVEKAAKESL